MSNLLQFVGGQRRVTQIIGSSVSSGLLTGSLGCDQKQLNSTAVSGQLQTVLSVTGAGALNVVAMDGMPSGGATSMRLRITLDGLVVLDKTVGLAVNTGFVGIGFPTEIYNSSLSRGEVVGIAPHRTQFRASCLVEVSTNLTGGGSAGRVFIASEIYE